MSLTAVPRAVPRLWNLGPVLLASALAFGSLDVQAQAYPNTTSAFSSLGNFSGSFNGALIASDWVLTAAHVAAGLQPGVTTFTDGNGSATVSEVFTYDGANTNDFPDNDIALVKLSSNIGGTPITLATTPLTSEEFANLGVVTLANSLSATQRSYGTATPVGYIATDTSVTPTATVNYLLTTGSTALVSGDSGSSLFSGSVTDSGELLGIASASISGSTDFNSGFVQVANYSAWIKSTMNAVPEPSSYCLLLLGLSSLALRKKYPAR